jgi:hypothetical protein
MEGRSRQVRFFSKVMLFVKEFGGHQSIVTVNPDIFTNVVVPEYQLDRQVDLIVTLGNAALRTNLRCANSQLLSLGLPRRWPSACSSTTVSTTS